MNRPTPVPLFNYKKRQRQALVSDPGQVLPGSSFRADQPTSSRISQEIQSKDNTSQRSTAAPSNNRSDMKDTPASKTTTMGCTSLNSASKFSSSKTTLGLMDMSGKFSNSTSIHQSSSKTVRKSSNNNTTLPSYSHGNQKTSSAFHDLHRGGGFNSSSSGTQLNAGKRNFPQSKGGCSRTGFTAASRGSWRPDSSSTSSRQCSTFNQPRVPSSTSFSSNLTKQQTSYISSNPFSFKDMSCASSPSSNVTSATNSSMYKAPHASIISSRGRGQHPSMGERSTQLGAFNSGCGFPSERAQEYASNSNIEGRKKNLDKQRNPPKTQPSRKEDSTKSALDTSLRIFTCPIASLKSWVDLKVNIGATMFEVYGLLDSATVKDPTKTGKEFVLRDDTDSIKCVFYEIDRELPRLTRGQVHRVVGGLDKKRCVLKVVSVRPAQKEERDVCQASSALSLKEMERLAGLSSEQ